ncbi:hypothetical protein E4T56_gene10278 [Termitomyces sp. T112]|nr:hypothetical protein E4T56_gene10278 [Termitomyces sp. T112]
MFRQIRRWLKSNQALWWSRIKLIYSRITLNRFTTLYFLFALLGCVVLVVLQGIAYSDSSKAAHILSNFTSGGYENGYPVLHLDGPVKVTEKLTSPSSVTLVCHNCTAAFLNSTSDGHDIEHLLRLDGLVKKIAKVSKKSSSLVGLMCHNCTAVFSNSTSKKHVLRLDWLIKVANFTEKAPLHITLVCQNCTAAFSNSTSNEHGIRHFPLDGLKIQNRGSADSKDDEDENEVHKAFLCGTSMYSLELMLNNERREDIVILCFNIWLLSMAVVTILNESLPHLGASLSGHVFGTGWAAYRLAPHELHEQLQDVEKFLTTQCDFNPPNNWLSVHQLHDIHISILASNIVVLLAMAFLSFKLFKVYASQSFSRIGSSSRVSKIYKIVLVFSACLQLGTFFLLASASIWIDLVVHSIGQHMQLYLVAFIVTLLLSLPWLYLGWVSVRKEGRGQFLAFSHVAVFLIVIFSLMFFSDFYQLIFKRWPFFAAITVTAFVLTISTAFLGIWCRMNFGRGLSQYLQATAALDDIDFTPETFRNDTEKGDTHRSTESARHIDEERILEIITEYIKEPRAAQKSPKSWHGHSVYSKNEAPLRISSTPSLLQERDWAAVKARPSVRRTDTFGNNHLNLESDGYMEPQMRSKSSPEYSQSKALYCCQMSCLMNKENWLSFRVTSDEIGHVGSLAYRD